MVFMGGFQGHNTYCGAILLCSVFFRSKFRGRNLHGREESLRLSSSSCDKARGVALQPHFGCRFALGAHEVGVSEPSEA